MEFLSTDKLLELIKHLYLENQFLYNCILSFLLSFFLTFTAIPKIIRVSYRKHLMDVPGKRSSHDNKIPNLGGVAIYYALCITSTIFAHELFSQYIFLFACLVILMFVGLMDDILVVAPDKKLYAQLVVSILIVVGSDIRIGNFFGVMGLEKIPYLISVVFTIALFIILINSFNLIDGIDGLAASIGILCSLAYIYSFYKFRELNMVILSITLIATLLAFLYFNLSKRNKIFMGDTGSMIVGFLLTFMAIKFLNLLMLESQSGRLYYHLPTAPAIAVAILIIPIVDTLTVGLIRIRNKKSPLSADRNHIHHRYLDLNLTHKQVTLILLSANALIILMTYLLRRLDVNVLMFIVLAIGMIFSILPFFIKKRIKI